MYVGPSLYQYGISFFPPRKMLGKYQLYLHISGG